MTSLLPDEVLITSPDITETAVIKAESLPGWVAKGWTVTQGGGGGGSAPATRVFLDVTTANATYVAFVGTLTGAAIQTALDAANAAGGGRVTLAAGTYLNVGQLTIGSNTTLAGQGMGATVLRRVANAASGTGTDGTNSGAGLINKDVVNGNPNIRLEGFTFDGNQSNQSHDQTHPNIELHKPANFVIDDVESMNADGDGIFINSDTVVTRVGHLGKVFCHNNMRHGLWVTAATREVVFGDVHCHDNVAMGCIIDVSEAEVVRIDAQRNGGAGVFIVNIYACNLAGISTHRNYRHGIYVIGLVSSNGSNWNAHSNSLCSRAVTGATTNGSTTITLSSGTFANDGAWNISGGLHPGLTITGTNIPAGTTIASVTNSTTAVLSQAATGTASGTTFTLGYEADIAFSGQSSLSYGITDKTGIFALTAGPAPSTSPWVTPYAGPYSVLENYGVYVDPLIVGDLKIIGAAVYPGTAGDWNVGTAGTTGNLVILDGVAGTANLRLLRGRLKIVTGVLIPPAYTTAGRPSAASATAAGQYYDTTLSKPVFSDGTNWRDAAGTIV